jgi:hypothetical protein
MRGLSSFVILLLAVSNALETPLCYSDKTCVPTNSVCANGEITSAEEAFNCYQPACRECTCDPAAKPAGETFAHGNHFVGPACVSTGTNAAGVDTCEWVDLSAPDCEVVPRSTGHNHTVENVSAKDARFCEVYLVVSQNPFMARAYNTFGLNDCPSGPWNAITEAQILARARTVFRIPAGAAVKAGPRWYIMDYITTTDVLPAPIELIPGIQMRQIGVLLAGALPPYGTLNVARHHTFHWNKGSMTYLLMAPDGQGWVMQSYNVTANTNAGNEFPGLKNQLTLPDGWKYHSAAVGNGLELSTPGGTATITRDNLGNNYQKLIGTDSPFDFSRD